VAAFGELHGGAISIDLVKHALRHTIGDPDRPVAIEQVQKTVCEFYHLKQAELVGIRKHKEVAQPRQVAMYLSRKLTGASFPDIARKFGNRDHTTVMHAVKKMERLSKENKELGTLLETLEKSLRNGK
jgi:chromosomal replication initiator protein